MKRKIRRAISSILMVAIVFSSITDFSPVKASATENVIYVTKNSVGQFVNTKDVKYALEGRLLQGQVYSLDDGTLLLQTSPDSYETVQRYTARLSDDNQMNAIMNEPSIPQEAQEDILKRSQQQAEIGNDMATVDVYTPNDSENDIHTISPMTTTDRYYTYVDPNGVSHKMKDTVLYYTALRSKECEYVSGINAGTIADGIDAFIIATAGINKYVGIFTTGLSILQSFLAAFGAHTYYGSAGDYATFLVSYDIWTKWTFVDMTGDGGWLAGAVTEQVYTRTVEWETYFVTDIGGNYKKDTEPYYEICTSPNFHDPAPKAVQWVGPGWIENDMSMTVYNTTFYY